MRRLLPIAFAAALGACALPYAGGAKPVAASRQLDATWYRATAVPAVKQQQQADCGLAALAMIGGAWGQHWTLDELSAAMPPGSDGVRLGTLRDYARAHGLEAYAIAGKPSDLEHELHAGRPVLLGLILPYDRKNNVAHYEVAIAMNPRDGTVITLDPATGTRMERAAKILDVEWKPSGYATLVVTGAAKVSRR